jgi:transcriptional regulator with XRE-family HTH domain
MTSGETVQQENSLQEKISACLILLKRNFGFSTREVAARVGMNENYLSGVLNGKRAGSDQLLKALEMLQTIAAGERFPKHEMAFRATAARLYAELEPIHTVATKLQMGTRLELVMEELEEAEEKLNRVRQALIQIASNTQPHRTSSNAPSLGAEAAELSDDWERRQRDSAGGSSLEREAGDSSDGKHRPSGGTSRRSKDTPSPEE